MTDDRAPVSERLLAAAPDAITAAVFVVLWLQPMALGESGVRNAVLIMLVEFILVHASGFLGAVVLAERVPRRSRVLGLVGFAVVYSLFIGVFMAVFGEWWPLVAFGWLLVGKFAGVIGRTGSASQRARMQAQWVLGVMFYVVGALLTVMLPLPRMGITVDLLPQLALPGGGHWVEQPHRAVAFGALYFAFTAWSKWRDWMVGAPTR